MEVNVFKPQTRLYFLTNQAISLIGISLLSTITFPLQMTRTRMQTVPQLIRQGKLAVPYKNIVDCFRRIKNYQGIRAFWKGNLANLMRAIPNDAFNFVTKQSIQLWVKKHKIATDSNISLNFISGSIGAIFTLAFIYPMQFARARLINDLSSTHSIKKVLVKIYKIQGFRGIYRGSMNYFVSSAIFRALYFGIFDSIKKLDPASLTNRIFGSYIASIVAIYSVYPFDTIRKRMMMTSGQSFKYGSFIDCALILYKKQGLKNFYNGWQLSLGQAIGVGGCLVFFDKIGTDVKNKTGL